MSDFSVIAATTEATLREVGKQALALGKGLQDAAPGNTGGVPPSISYLLEMGEQLNALADQCNATFMQGK
jgi:hypothetical protein